MHIFSQKMAFKSLFVFKNVITRVGARIFTKIINHHLFELVCDIDHDMIRRTPIHLHIY